MTRWFQSRRNVDHIHGSRSLPSHQLPYGKMLAFYITSSFVLGYGNELSL